MTIRMLFRMLHKVHGHPPDKKCHGKAYQHQKARENEQKKNPGNPEKQATEAIRKRDRKSSPGKTGQQERGQAAKSASDCDKMK